MSKSSELINIEINTDSEYDDFDKVREFFRSNSKNVREVEEKSNNSAKYFEKNSKIDYSYEGNVESTPKLFKSKKEEKISMYQLAEVIKEKINFIVINNIVYIYKEEYGYYKALQDSELEHELRRALPYEIKIRINNSVLNEVIRWLKTFDTEEREINNNNRYINFINGYYDLYYGEFLKDNREKLYFGHFVNSEYKESDLSGVFFEEYINNVTNKDYELRNLLQEILGVAISGIRGFKKAIFIIGCANSGKTTFLSLLDNLIGKEFISNLGLADLNDKFRLANIFNMRLNTCGEVSELSLKRLDIFKSITGNDLITAERKGRDPFSFKNNAMLIFAGNYLPEISVTDISNAFFKRMIIIPFNQSIPEDKININLMDRLLEEKEYIIKFAIEGLTRFIDNGYKFTESREVANITQEYLYENASFQSFLKEECIIDGECKETSSDLIEYYKDFCYEKCVTPITERLFHKYMKQVHGVKRCRFRCSGGNLYGYSGIRLTSRLV